MIKVTVCGHLLVDWILSNGWSTPEEENLYKKIENAQVFKKLIEADIVSVYLHPGLSSFIQVSIEDSCSSRQQFRDQMRQLNQYITLENNISLDQCGEDFVELDLPEESCYHEGLILVSAKMIKADAVVCTEDSKVILKQILELNPKFFKHFQTPIYDLGEFLAHLNQDVRFIPKIESCNNSIFVKTPKGRIVELPCNATPIDFAHSLHTKFTTSCIGAVVDGIQVPLNHILRGGETIEIVRGKPNDIFKSTNLNATLYSDLEKYLRLYCRKKSTVKALTKAFERSYRKKGWKIINKSLNKNQRRMLEEASIYNDLNSLKGIKSRRDLVLYLGLGRIKIEELQMLLDSIENVEYSFFLSPYNKDLLKTKRYNISICCNPSLNDDIAGIISSGRRPIRVHTKCCDYIKHMHSDDLIDLQWNCDLLGVNLQLNLYNQPGALSELIVFLDKDYCWEYNIHSVQPIKENRSSQVLTQVILKKGNTISELLTDIQQLKKLNRVRVRDISPLNNNMVNNFFYGS
ncbi:TGS domain-containing protein [[Leptolyngbya] sp. PCC 7376]|uniref:TGS domain-containing protein n=1 Tax=[Leptolyngbya] sp. PCC 7376 TaxID=111781 RepID=UPI00029EE251|nr:TGS domain-containing protein [[Leptolyngbya] sp. PCC 7376]AFY40119.1 TGS domain-containing protein [[Leptolyngbya] sp. PCC 7376]